MLAVQTHRDHPDLLPSLAFAISEAMRNYKATPRELSERRSRKLRRMLRHCYDNVPLYHDWIRNAGVVPEDVKDTRDLRRLPTLTREVLSASYPSRIVSKGSTAANLGRTSGTTGTPLRILRDPHFYDTRLALAFRRSWVDGVRPWHKGAVVWTGDGFARLSSVSVIREAMALGKGMLLWGGDARIPTLRQLNFFVGRGEWRAAANLLRSYRPDVLYGRPSQIRRIGLALEETRAQVRPRVALTSGEFLSGAVRGDIESILGCPVYDSYGSGEMGGLGFECPQHSGVHLNSDFFVFEVVRDGEEVSPGEAGEIVITGLTNFVMPLIRYEQRDRVVKGEEGACGCGSCLPRLRSIQGRLDDGLVAPDGSMVSPGMVCEKLEAEFGMRDFQLVQKNVDRFIMRVLAGDATEANAARVRGFLSELVGAKFHLEIEEWKIDDLPVKYRPVSSEVKPI